MPKQRSIKMRADDSEQIATDPSSQRSSKAMPRSKRSETLASTLPTRSELVVVRAALVLCRDFIESQFKGSNPVFSVEGQMWSKDEVQEYLAKALSVIPRNDVP
jgi:hypothetical protein